MTIRHKLEAGGAVLALLVIAFLFIIWKQNHDAVLRGEGATEARIEVEKKVAAMTQQIAQREHDTAMLLAAKDEVIASKDKRLAQNPAVEGPNIIHAAIPSSQGAQPITINMPAVPATPTTPAVPAQQFTALPTSQFNQIQTDVAAKFLKCESTEAKLTACEANRETDAERFANEEARYAALEKENESWKIAAGHGGGFWVRLKRNAKWVAVVGVTGGITYAVGRSGR